MLDDGTTQLILLNMSAFAWELLKDWVCEKEYLYDLCELSCFRAKSAADGSRAARSRNRRGLNDASEFKLV